MVWLVAIIVAARTPRNDLPIGNEFNANFLKHYVNFHRPQFFPETITNAKGKEWKKYPVRR
jgi:hypothetical protein